MKCARLAALTVLMTAAPVLAAPPAWTVDMAKSQVGFSGTQAGTPFTGRFGTFSAAIRFDPKDLAHSSARVTFATASARTGNQMQDSSLGQSDWFDVAHFPQAHFVTSQISATGGNGYVAKGTLTIKDKSLPVTLPFTLVIQDGAATMKGSTSVDRLAFGLGAMSDPAGAYVSRKISVTVNLVAKQSN